MIAIIVNGEPVEVEENTRIRYLLKELGITSERLAVEINKEAIPRSNILGTILKEGDVLEVYEVKEVKQTLS